MGKVTLGPCYPFPLGPPNGVFHVMGCDRFGFPSLYREHNNKDVAETMAYEAAAKLIARHPEKGPIEQWRWEVFNIPEHTKKDA